MAAVDEMTALRAEVLRLKELMTVKDQLLVSKDAQLASKEEVIASKVEMIASKNAQLSSKDEVTACKEALLSRSAKELQQYQNSTASKKSAAAGDDRPDAEQPCSKRQRLHSSSSSNVKEASALDKDEVLDHVYGFVGGGDHLYVGGVSRRWRGRYMQYCAQNCSSDYDKKLVTKQRNVLMSASRLQLALISGLAVANWTFQKWSRAELVCQYSLEPQQVMTLLRVHGVRWSSTLCDVAAKQSKLALLQWLHTSSCPLEVPNVLMTASRGGSVAMLE
jgi:hypothetical protein